MISKFRPKKIASVLMVAGILVPISTSVAVAQTAGRPTDLTSERVEQADKEPQNWLTSLGNYQAWSYSSLNQITRDNVKHLVPVWAFPTGGNGLESAPIVAGGVLYLENPEDDVFALDASTGSLLWKKKYDYTAGTRTLVHRGRGVDQPEFLYQFE